MKNCQNCGVELDEVIEVCPLCEMPVTNIPEGFTGSQIENSDSTKENFISGYEKLTIKQRRMIFWELSGIILFSGVLVTFIIDFVTSGRISWSKYTVTICLVLFVNITLLSFWQHRLVLVVCGSFVSTSALIVLLDMYNLKIGWGTKLGVPLLLSFYVMLLILIMLIRITRKKGLNVLAYIFIAAGLFTLCSEAALSIYFSGKIHFEWSLIVFVSVIPIATILFFIHYRLNKGMELKRFFHI